MVLLTSLQDLSQASGIIDTNFFESIYEGFMDEAMGKVGRTVTLHLSPVRQQDSATQSAPAAQQYNPFFGGVAVPSQTSKHTGVKFTHRDVQYSAQIKIGPLKEGEDTTGMGDLKANEAVITLVIEALPHLKETRSISIEGLRYSIIESKSVGFSRRKYVLVKLREINETEAPSADPTMG